VVEEQSKIHPHLRCLLGKILTQVLSQTNELISSTGYGLHEIIHSRQPEEHHTAYRSGHQSFLAEAYHIFLPSSPKQSAPIPASACLLPQARHHAQLEIAAPYSAGPKRLVSIHTKREIELDSEVE
jgi:hypothetical protein